jgi:hypothetical protein
LIVANAARDDFWMGKEIQLSIAEVDRLAKFAPRLLNGQPLKPT